MTKPLAILLAIAVFAFATDGDRGSGTSPPPDGERREVEAPVESFDLLILESFPPQYNVEIVSGLSNGCHLFERYETVRNDTDIRIIVWNTVLVDDDTVCAEIYGMHTGGVTIGSDFESGTEYTLTVGDKTETLVAQ
jgi:hypothetical protein